MTEPGAKYATRNSNTSSQYFLAYSRELTITKTTLLFRLTTGHVQLRRHLYHFQLANTPLANTEIANPRRSNISSSDAHATPRNDKNTCLPRGRFPPPIFHPSLLVLPRPPA